jgi:hypothetical protein
MLTSPLILFFCSAVATPARAELPPAWKEPRPTTEDVDKLIESEPPSGDPGKANPIERRTLRIDNEGSGAQPAPPDEDAVRSAAKLRRSDRAIRRRTLKIAEDDVKESEGDEPSDPTPDGSPKPAAPRKKQKAKARK